MKEKEFNTPWELDYDEELELATIEDSNGQVVLQDIPVTCEEDLKKLEYIVEAVNSFPSQYFTRNHTWEKVYQEILTYVEKYGMRPDAYLMNREDYPTYDTLPEGKIPTRWQYVRNTTTGDISILGVPIHVSFEKSFKSSCIIFPK